MSAYPPNPPKSPKSPNRHRFSRQGFQPLSNSQGSNEMSPKNATIEIPLEQVVTHSSSTGFRQNGGVSPVVPDGERGFNEKTEEKSGLFHRGPKGRRKAPKLDSKVPTSATGIDEEDDAINKMGKIYFAILNFSIVTRYFIYILPLGIAIMIPIIIFATVAHGARIGSQEDDPNTDANEAVTGVRFLWLFVWIEIFWLSLWTSKIFAHFLPGVFQFLAGVVSSGVRKYALVIKKLEIPLSLVGWFVCSVATFKPLMYLDGASHDQDWIDIVFRILTACMVSSVVLLVEKLLIQLISINYHRKQFNGKIRENKRNIHLLSLLYDASRAIFPAYCNEFAHEDYIINDSLNLGLGSKKNSHMRSGSATPMRLLHDVGRLGDKVTSVFGHVAQEITGKQVFDPNSAHSIVIEALEKSRSSEALARRLWMSFVVEGKNELFAEDIQEVLGSNREKEAEECFSALDRDGNGDISLDEMILTVAEFGRERKSIANSMHDVDQAINVLDGLLATVVFVVAVFIFIAFLNASFVTTLATAGTALLSLSFVFAVTCQEVLGSCIFLFVKHPYDIGDRVDVNLAEQLTVEHISLLFTVFKRVSNGKMVQIPNIVLNSLWIENVSRSKAMREIITTNINFDTSFEDIKALKNEIQAFVLDKENNRDFFPEVEVEVTGVNEMDKMELRVLIWHKSNWANETVRAARRSKFMCALVLALRRVPIYGPGAGDAALGDQAKPTYAVTVSEEEASAAREKFAADKEAKRLFPSKPVVEDPNSENDNGKSSSVDYLGGGLAPRAETAAISNLTARPPGVDHTRDQAWNARDDVSTLGRPSTDGRPDLEEVGRLLHKQESSGKRRAAGPSIPIISEPRPSGVTQQEFAYAPPVPSTQYAAPPQQTYQLYAAQQALSPPGEEWDQMMGQDQQQQQQQQQQPGQAPGPAPGHGYQGPQQSHRPQGQ